MSRTTILAALYQASQNNPIATENPRHFDSMIYDKNDLVNTYLQYQKNNMANVVVTTQKNLDHEINKIIKSTQIDELLCAQNIAQMQIDSKKLTDLLNTTVTPYTTQVDSMREKIFNIKASILHAQAGVANLGIVGLGTSEYNPRLISLVVQTCIILLKKEDIVPNLFEAFQKLRVTGQDSKLPTNIVFLAGPSRTADIELQTVFGVHGPQNIFVVLYE